MVEFRPIEPLLLTPTEACQVLRLDADRDEQASLRALRRLVETKQLRPCRVGKGNRFALYELQRFIRHRTEQQWEVED